MTSRTNPSRWYFERGDQDGKRTLSEVREASSQERPILLRGATIVSMDPEVGDFTEGDVLIRGESIIEVSADAGTHPDARGAVPVDLRGMILLPGLVDAHRHCWQGQFRRSMPDADLEEYIAAMHGSLAPRYEPDDIAIGTLVSLLASLNSGVTTVLDFSHNARTPEHSDAAFRSYEQSGIRAVHAAAAPRVGAAGHWPEDAVRLRSAWARRGNARVSVRLGLYTPQRDRMAELIAYGRDNALAISVDAVAGDSGSDLVLELSRRGSLGRDITLIHCTGLSHEAWMAIADSGTRVTMAPTSDSLIGLGNGSAPVHEVLARSVCASISTDVEVSLGGDMFAEMRAALVEQRRVVQARRAAGSCDRARIDARAVLEFATMGGAHAVGLADTVGSLTPGKAADIIGIRGQDVETMPMNSPVGTAVLAGSPGLVDFVLASGAPRKWSGKLLDTDIDALRERVLQSRTRIEDQAQ